MKRKFLITGAAGFIGSHLVEHLIAEGIDPQDMRLFIPEDESLENLPSGEFEIIRGDIRDKKLVNKITQDVDVIYHLAAATRDADGEYLEVNWKGTKNLVEACENKKIKKFVFFSTIAVFGLPAFTKARTNITEESPENVIGEYAISKKRAENELIKIAKKYKMPYAIVRPTTVYGPRDKAGIYQLYRSIAAHYFIRIGNGRNRMDYVYVEDVVKGARKAEIDSRKFGDYILGARQPVTFRKIVDKVAKSIDTKVPDWYIPRSLGLVCGYIAGLVNKLSGFKIPLSMDRVKVMTADYYFDSSKAIREIQYNPSVSFEKGATLTAKWFLKEGRV